MTSTIGAFTKNEYKFSFEHTVSYFSAVAAQQYYLTNESWIAFKNVLSASGDANFVVMCANNSVDGGEVAYAVAAFMFKRILPAEAPKDDAAGRIEKPMALVTALMSACEDASVPESLDMKSSRLFQELQLIDNVFHHKVGPCQGRCRKVEVGPCPEQSRLRERYVRQSDPSSGRVQV